MNDKLDDKDKNIFLFINRNNNVYACLDMKSPCLSNNDLKGKITLNLPFRGDYKISKYIHDNLKEAEKEKLKSRLKLKVENTNKKLKLIIIDIINLKLDIKCDSSSKLNITKKFDAIIKRASKLKQLLSIIPSISDTIDDKVLRTIRKLNNAAFAFKAKFNHDCMNFKVDGDVLKYNWEKYYMAKNFSKDEKNEENDNYDNNECRCNANRIASYIKKYIENNKKNSKGLNLGSIRCEDNSCIDPIKILYVLNTKTFDFMKNGYITILKNNYLK